MANIEITRRRALFNIGMGIATLTVSPVLIGCTQSDKDRIAQLVQVLGTASAGIALQLGQTDLANQIKTSLPPVVKTINDWQLGTAPAETAIQALNTLMNLLYLIPPVSQYAALIDLAIVTAEALLALIPAPVAPGIAKSRAMRPRAIPAPTAPVPQSTKDFKKQWNAICDSGLELKKMKI